MVYLLYDILLHMVVLFMLPYFLVKMFAEGKYRTGIPERFAIYRAEKLKPIEGGQKVVWFHAVSVGETKAVLPLLKMFKERHPELKVVFSTVTSTANRLAMKEAPMLIDVLIYMPLDLSWVVRRALRSLRPSLFIAVEKEIWPNLIHRLEHSGVPIVVVNGTISERSFGRYRRFALLFKDTFSAITRFCARTDEDRERAIELGVPPERAVTTGNLKFDMEGAISKKTDIEAIRQELAIAGDAAVLVAGSTHQGEEEAVLRVFLRLKERFPKLRLVLAPRHPERFNDVETLLKTMGVDYIRRTASGGRLSEGLGADVVLLDTIGELSKVYAIATVAFVGGSLVEGVGGHNLLEPAIFAKPVVYGSHIKSYTYMAELLEKEGGGIRVDGEEGLFDALSELIADPQLCATMGRAARRVVDKNRGATARTLEIIDTLLSASLNRHKSRRSAGV